MAGDWTPMRHDLIDHPKVWQLSRALSVNVHETIGMLFHFWSWAERFTTDGRLNDVELSDIDRVLRAENAGKSLLEIGWLLQRSEGLTIPRFTEWMSQGAKRRLLTAKRVRQYRKRSCNAPALHKRYTSVTTEQNRTGQDRTGQKRTEQNINQQPDDDEKAVSPNRGLIDALPDELDGNSLGRLLKVGFDAGTARELASDYTADEIERAIEKLHERCKRGGVRNRPGYLRRILKAGV